MLAPPRIGVAMPPRVAVTFILGALVSISSGAAPQSRPGRGDARAGLALGVEPLDHSVTGELTLQLSPHGDLVRREAPAEKDARKKAEALLEADRHTKLGKASAATRADPAGDGGAPADIVSDGVVTVVSPVQTTSEQLKLEEQTEECMQDEPTAECMEKFGSYGVRKMFTESWDNVKKLGYRRPGWMSHPEVQKRKLFELTLPGTVNSGTYAITGQDSAAAGVTPYGVVSQNLDFYQQMELGIRMFDLKVAYSTENSLVYISHGALMVPMATGLRDIRRFLEEHEREVIVLDVRMDENADASHLTPLREEAKSATRIPGQLVHEAIKCELKEMLATYAVLSQLPGNAKGENPTIGALTDIGAHVIYFWDSQQVLCTSFTECTRTPGWYPSDRAGGYPFAFGPPFALGTRINATGGRETARMIEPACITHSSTYTKDDQPERLLKKLKTWAKDMAAKTTESRPKCFPIGAALPGIHSPTIMYTADTYITASTQEQAVQADRMRGVKAIYTRGEGYTVKTDAERTNYLLLNWFLKKNNQEIFTKPNMILFEFASSAPVPILRVIEAMQNRPECGMALYCKASGSCWADTLLGKEDKCIPEEEVLTRLKEHANGKEDTSEWVVYATIALCSVLFCCCVCGCLGQIVKMLSTPAGPKDAEASLTGGGDDGQHSELPGSEAASNHGEVLEEPPAAS